MNSFSIACGVSGPLQLTVNGPSSHESEVHLLHQPFALIGRDQRADISLDHKLVSRRHVYLQIVDGQAFWVDLDSRSGTLSEGILRRSGWLEAGKPIEIGPFEVQRQLAACLTADSCNLEPRSQVSPLVARSHGGAPLPEVALEFLNGPSRSARWPMNRVMSLIGSAEGCKFRLADPSVSSFHCSLVRTPVGLWVVDLLGSNTASVNDALMRYALLADNDVLRVGRYRIRIRLQFAGRGNEANGITRRIPTTVSRSTPGCEPMLAPIVTTRTPMRHEPAPGVLEAQPAQGQLASTEWLSPAMGEPIRLDRGELTESVLVPLINQFGLMQQQMLDQFQQTIATLVQTFSALHRDQMNLIREELDRLSDLTKEFHSLKHELAARAQNLAERAPVVPRPSAEWHPPQGEIQRFAEGVMSRIDTSASSQSSQSSRVAIGSGRDSSTPAPRSRVAMESAASLPNPLVASAQEGHGPAAPLTQPEPERSKLESDRDVMVWLHQRMTTLQQERETRWQKIMKLLPGVS
jgi:predicted component of type VI protein secretion system